MDDLYETEINQDELIFPKQEELIAQVEQVIKENEEEAND